MRIGGLLLAALAFVLGAAGCGGGGASAEKKLDVAGIGITFAYPSRLEPIKDLSFARTAGAKAAARGGVALDTDNAIIVSRYDLRVPITTVNLTRFKPEIDSVIGQIAGKGVTGRQVDYGGLPGYEYVISLPAPGGASSRMAVLFDRTTEYLVNCQSTPRHRTLMAGACRRALDTLEKK